MYNTVIVTDNEIIFIGSTGLEYMWCSSYGNTNLNQFEMIDIYNSNIPYEPAHPITSIIYI